jgi:hypothetical protein
MVIIASVASIQSVLTCSVSTGAGGRLGAALGGLILVSGRCRMDWPLQYMKTKPDH